MYKLGHPQQSRRCPIVLNLSLPGGRSRQSVIYMLHTGVAMIFLTGGGGGRGEANEKRTKRLSGEGVANDREICFIENSCIKMTFFFKMSVLGVGYV